MLKKVISLVLVLCTLLCVMCFASAEHVKLQYSSSSLTLRKGKGTNYAAVAYLTDGQYVSVLEKGSIWSKVETSSGKVGYIKNLYISGIGSQYADGTTYYAKSYSGTVKTKYSTSTVALRAGASTSCAKIKNIKSGTKLTVIGKNGSWYLVKLSDGTNGFMSSNYVSTSAKPTTKTYAKVTASSLNMRSGAGVSYKLITTLANGAKVEVLQKYSSSWWKVKYGSHTGYMSAKYLKIVK